MLEKMGDFFDARVDGYENHQLSSIESAHDFYPYTASCLPLDPGIKVLDLGCGTGLELKEYFSLNPTAKITGIDLSPEMLNALREKFPNKEMNLILGSYFDVPFGVNEFDCGLSVESLHHFTKEEKIPLYRKLRQELMKIRSEQKLSDSEFYHYDTPLTVEHEMEAFLEAGFSSVKVLNHWSATYTLKAIK